MMIVPSCSSSSLSVDSLHVPFSGPGRTIRVQGWKGPLQDLIAALEDARGRKYNVSYPDPAEAASKQEEARIAGDDRTEMMYSIKVLLASGFGVADGTGSLDNASFDVQPEYPVDTFRRVFNGQ
jgi:hypothetical protein